MDAGAQAANGTQIRISYDFNGDGVYDRVETYRYFAEDNRSEWEAYTQRAGLQSSIGAFANLLNGSIKVEVWNAIGASSVGLRTGLKAAANQERSRPRVCARPASSTNIRLSWLFGLRRE